jgi:hypothetical protein
MGWGPLSSQRSPKITGKGQPSLLLKLFFPYFVFFHCFVIYFKFFINPCRSIFYSDISIYNTNHITQLYYNYYLNKPFFLQIFLK